MMSYGFVVVAWLILGADEGQKIPFSSFAACQTARLAYSKGRSIRDFNSVCVSTGASSNE